MEKAIESLFYWLDRSVPPRIAGFEKLVEEAKQEYETLKQTEVPKDFVEIG